MSELAFGFRGEAQLREEEKRTAQSKRRAVLFRLKASFLGGKKGALVGEKTETTHAVSVVREPESFR